MWTERRSGQTMQRTSLDHRDPYERDRTRVIHCPAFRRLQRKTQILGTDEGDFHRTRLTHSLEVASIGRSILRNLAAKQDEKLVEILPNDDLMSVICLLHDIGHPPFGHGGETALNYMMRHFGGFEGNAQTLRLLTKVERCYGDYGLDLTRRALLGILKYPVMLDALVARDFNQTSPLQKILRVNDWIPPKGYFRTEQEEVRWLLSTFPESDSALFQSVAQEPSDKAHGQAKFCILDCSIMNIADDIAYGVHDLEDAIHLGLVNRAEFDTEELRKLYSAAGLDGAALLNALFDPIISIRKQAIGEMVNYFITATKLVTTNNDFENLIMKYNLILPSAAKSLLMHITQFIYEQVIDSQESRIFEHGGQMVVLRLFEAISSNPTSLLDLKNRVLFQEASDENTAMRVVCDYIANMTDEYAYRMHERLFGFNTRILFERM